MHTVVCEIRGVEGDNTDTVTGRSDVTMDLKKKAFVKNYDMSLKIF